MGQLPDLLQSFYSPSFFSQDGNFPGNFKGDIRMIHQGLKGGCIDWYLRDPGWIDHNMIPDVVVAFTVHTPDLKQLLFGHKASQFFPVPGNSAGKCGTDPSQALKIKGICTIQFY